LKEKAVQYYITVMHSEYKITKENRMKAVRNKMEEFAKSKLVITDRLHGMIFAAITETPCIVFSNYNHKVKGTYEWIKYLPYIKYIESVEEAKKYIPELLKMDNCKFDNKPLQPYFDKLAEVIQSHTKK
jgi:pyruvyl transferase EpsI